MLYVAMWLFGLVLLILQTNAQTTGFLKFQDSNSTCPTWTYYDNVTQAGKCGKNIFRIQIVSCTTEDKCPTSGNVRLTEANVGVLFGYCLTQNSKQRDLVVGACPHNHLPHSLITNQYKAPYFQVPNDISQLDSAMCQQLGGYRTGQLCGQCVDGYSPPVYSYYTQCIRCSTGTNNWPKYLAVSLLPTTVFFLVLLIFRFRATSPRLNGYILICQMVTSCTSGNPTCNSFSWENKHHTTTAGDVKHLESKFFQNSLLSILPASKCLHTASAVSGLHHSSLPSCPHHPHLHTSQTPLPQLHTCGVAVDALHQLLCSLSKAVGHSELTRGCLCNLPPPLLCQVSKCLIRYSPTNISVEHEARATGNHALP